MNKKTDVLELAKDWLLNREEYIEQNIDEQGRKDRNLILKERAVNGCDYPDCKNKKAVAVRFNITNEKALCKKHITDFIKLGMTVSILMDYREFDKARKAKYRVGTVIEHDGVKYRITGFEEEHNDMPIYEKISILKKGKKYGSFGYNSEMDLLSKIIKY